MYYTLKKYKSLTPYAEGIDVCFRSDSEIPDDFIKKPYTVWNVQDSIKNISNEDIQKLYRCFRLDQMEMHYNKNHNNTLIIQNSYGLLKESILGLNRKK